jgi:hypothetical protein
LRLNDEIGDWCRQIKKAEVVLENTMASIKDYEGFEITITPQYISNWCYQMNFIYKGKPLFNPELTQGKIIKADEWNSFSLLLTLKDAIECVTPEKSFSWLEWEEEISIGIEYKKHNKLADDGFFIFGAFISGWFFKDGQSNTMDNEAGINLMVYRDDLKKLYKDLGDEMLVIYEGLPSDRQKEAGVWPMQAPDISTKKDHDKDRIWSREEMIKWITELQGENASLRSDKKITIMALLFMFGFVLFCIGAGYHIEWLCEVAGTAFIGFLFVFPFIG